MTTMREQVARVLDREAFSEGPWMWVERQQAALTKADAIIAMLSARPAGVEGSSRNGVKPSAGTLHGALTNEGGE